MFFIVDTLGQVTNKIYKPASIYHPQQILFNAIQKEYYVLGFYYNQNEHSELYVECFDTLFQSKFIKLNYTGKEGDYLIGTNIAGKTIYSVIGTTAPPPPPNPWPGSGTRYIKMRFNNQTLSMASDVFGPTYSFDHMIGGSNVIIDKENVVYSIFGPDKTMIFFCDTFVKRTCYADVKIDSMNITQIWHIGLTPSGKLFGTGLHLDHKYNSINFLSINYRKFVADGCGSDVSIHENEKFSKFQVFPNPVVSILTITGPPVSDVNTKFEVLDLLGRPLLNFSVLFLGKSEIDVSSLKKGSYFLRISNNDSISNVKFIKD